jgi:hypothetical protein
VVLEGRLTTSPDPLPAAPEDGVAAWRLAAANAGAATPLGRMLESLLRRFDAGAAAEILDEELDDALLEVAPSEDREAVRAEVGEELVPYRGRMSNDEYESTLRKASARRLRVRLALPRLGLPISGSETSE